MGPVQQQITQKLNAQLDLQYLEVINESNMHNVPPGSESHFKIVAVSNDFSGKPLLARHRMINTVLKQELDEQIHALALHTYTPEQWDESQGVSPQSPPCLGGSK